MTLLRSALYQILFLSWTLLVSVSYLPLLALASRRQMQRAAGLWLDGALWLQKTVLRLSYQVIGREHLPTGSALFAAKHQSAFETMVFHRLVDDPAFVLKRELLRLPLFGWYLRKTGQIAIDRSAGAHALRQMLEGSQRAVAEGRSLVIFPEGHRQAPGHAGRYHSGVARLYAALGIPVVPVAVNSGMFWPRNAFLRHPGRITLEILPPIAPGLGRAAFMDLLQQRIESATRTLEAEAARQRANIEA